MHLEPYAFLSAGDAGTGILGRAYASRISNKIIGVLGLFALLCIALTILAAGSFNDLAVNEQRLLDHSATSLRLAAEAQEHLTRLHQLAFQINQSEAAVHAPLLKKFASETEELNADLLALTPLLGADDARDFQIATDSVAQYIPLTAEVRSRHSAQDAAGGNVLLQSAGAAIFDRGDGAFDRLVTDKTEELAAGAAEAQSRARTSLGLMVAAAILGLVAIGAIALLIVRHAITAPLRTVTGALNGLASGDLQADVVEMQRADEIGDLSRAFRAFRQASIDYRATEEAAKMQILAAHQEAETARAAAESANAAKSTFLANMSHEIRTPLNGILGMAQVLEMGELSAEQAEQVGTILDSGRNLMAVLNDVLDISKIEAGKFTLATADADLQHLLGRVRRLWQPRADEKALELQLSFDADMPKDFLIDALRVQQCVSNLVSNAIKFTETGSIAISARSRPLPEGDHVVEIRVRDTGIGMSPETAARLFKPFSQADESSSRRFGGTGLGLSITRRLAELMGGDATVTSEIGRGSEFTLTFRAGLSAEVAKPVAALPSTSDSAREALRGGNLRVLVVDDNAINRRVAALFLAPFTLHIVEAANGVEALSALEHDVFDLVLLDMHMPVMDGPTTILRIRSSGKRWAGIPVVALTADAMSGDRERYLAMGIDGYLSKPLGERDLILEIARVRAGEPPKLARAS